MRSIWIAPVFGLAWSCGGDVDNSPQSVVRDASVDALSVADSSVDALRDSEASGAESDVASCAFSGFGPPTTYDTAYVSVSLFAYAPQGGPPDFAVSEPYGPDGGGAVLNYEVFANSGTGAFSPGTFHGASGINFDDAVIGDFRRGGFADIASVQLSPPVVRNGVFTVDRNLGDGDYDNQLTSYNTPDPGGSLVAGDFNGDGFLDLAIAGVGLEQPCLENCQWYAFLLVYPNLGDGTFGSAVTYSNVGGEMTSIATGDFDGDGHLDIALPPNAIMLNQGDGTFGDPVALPNVPSSVSGVDSGSYEGWVVPWVVGDFNGDGLTDIATSATTTANVDELIVFFSTGGGAFGQPTTYAVSAAPQHMVVGDFNGDGHPDIAIQYQGQGSTDGDVNAPLPIGLLLNRGDGSFGSETSYTMGPNPCWIAAADFNGDGVSDLAVVNGGSANGVTVMLSQCQ
jgi:hypothetical protein